jgi:hypothetical protein
VEISDTGVARNVNIHAFSVIISDVASPGVSILSIRAILSGQWGSCSGWDWNLDTRVEAFSDFFSRHSVIKSNTVGLNDLSPSGEASALKTFLLARNIPVGINCVWIKSSPSDWGNFYINLAVNVSINVHNISISCSST